MRVPCPYCGHRDSLEFVYRGDARPVRPVDDIGLYEYLYLRDNPSGLVEEHWYHAFGCRTWITVQRHTLTHEISGSRLAQDSAR
jgi:methylglutamate dehydrogenase subunit B